MRWCAAAFGLMVVFATIGLVAYTLDMASTYVARRILYTFMAGLS